MELIITPFNLDDFKKYSQADSYLVGNNGFGVRLAASFSLEELEQAVSVAHNLGKQLYINVNKVFTQNELRGLTTYLEYLKSIEVDGIFFSDFGVYTIAKRLGISDKLIYCSETQLVNYADVLFLQTLNLKGIIISKDVTMSDIEAIATHCKGNLGLHSYGYYHLFYSKRPLLSAYFENYNRDGRRFIENQHLTIKEQNRTIKMPVYEDQNGLNVMSGDILLGIDYLHHFETLGYQMFIIDGIGESSEYLGTILDYYIKAKSGVEHLFDVIQKQFDTRVYSTAFYFRKLSVADKEGENV